MRTLLIEVGISLAWSKWHFSTDALELAPYILPAYVVLPGVLASGKAVQNIPMIYSTQNYLF